MVVDCTGAGMGGTADHAARVRLAARPGLRLQQSGGPAAGVVPAVDRRFGRAAGEHHRRDCAGRWAGGRFGPVAETTRFTEPCLERGLVFLVAAARAYPAGRNLVSAGLCGLGAGTGLRPIEDCVRLRRKVHGIRFPERRAAQPNLSTARPVAGGLCHLILLLRLRDDGAGLAPGGHHPWGKLRPV